MGLSAGRKQLQPLRSPLDLRSGKVDEFPTQVREQFNHAQSSCQDQQEWARGAVRLGSVPSNPLEPTSPSPGTTSSRSS